MKRKLKSHKPSLPLPLPTAAQTAFKSATMRTSFCLSLSQPMIEFLCAVADDVEWDRSQFHTIHRPDNPWAPFRALEKRGLVIPKPDDERRTTSEILQMPANRLCEYSHWKLTPIGQSVVQMLKVAGIFVEADAAITRRARKA